MEASAERAPLPVTIIADPLPPLPSIIEATAYFVAAEALTNAVKHAGASHVWITVHHTDAQLQVEIDDDTAVAAVDLRRTHPEIGVLVLSQHLESRYLHTLLGDNARGVGYLLKERVTGIRGFVDAVREVAAGGCVVDPEVVAVMVRGRRIADPTIGSPSVNARCSC
ncbi:MAG: ATP-binding protein [Pseudonocardiaceae bacterium]